MPGASEDAPSTERPSGPPPSGDSGTEAHWPSAADLRQVSDEISSLYPPPRLGTEIVLLEVNPHRAHAYWNIDVEDFRDGHKRCGMDRPPLVLRLYDVTGLSFDGSNAHQVFDIEIQGLQGHWYLDLWKDGRTHVADLGFRRPDGSLVCLARSNPVSTPPAAESADYHTLAVDTAESDRPVVKLTDLITDPNLSPQNVDPETGVPVETYPDEEFVVQPTAAPFQPPDHVVEERPITVPLEPSGAPGTQSFPWPVEQVPLTAAERREDVSVFFERAVEEAAPASQPWQSPDSPPSHGSDPLRAAGHVPGEAGETPADTAADRWPSAEELARHVPDTSGNVQHPPTPAAGAAPEPAPEIARGQAESAGRGAAGSSPMPLENYVSLSSLEPGRRVVSLEVNVELHIFGRAKPGTELTLYGQQIPLRPDGSFSVRKPLPQGAVVLPLLAVDPPPENGT